MVKIISYEQECRIEDFIKDFKNKTRVYGAIHIVIADDYFSIDHKTFLDSDIAEAHQIGFDDGIDHLEDTIEKMSGIDLSEYIDEDHATELCEYYKSKKE